MNIYISNLGDKITDESLRTLFAEHGKVNSAKVITDHFTGYPRGFAFVDMPDETEASLAITKINGSILEGQTLSVKEARPKEEHKGSYAVGKKY
ncbi:MAG TPA: RNA-binding protein [Flavisolibacter sp.]|jgi:RNA recognition motif-containing protein|nr:RNA-binding protein [Flavisolibacter sp.]